MTYTNSPLVDVVMLSPFHSGRRTHVIDTVTVHCTAVHVTVEQLGAIFQRKGRNASSNYGIGDDGRIGLYVDEANRSWCSSSASNDQRAITIEVSSDSEHPYAVTQAAYDSLIRLLADICKRNNIDALRWKADKRYIGMPDVQNMTVHRGFANKACPGDYLYNRHGQIAAAVNKILQEEDDDNTMTQEQFNGMMNVYLSELKKQPAQPYAQDALAWAAKQGLMVGDGNGNQQPMMFLAREDEVLIEYRAEKRIAEAIRKALKDLGL